jgi:hypothetical protein
MKLKMKIYIRVKDVVAFDFPEGFPFYRMEYIGDNEKVYWKFYGAHKVTRIHEKMCETSILCYDDKNADFILDLLTEEMFKGDRNFSVIYEENFDKALQRLINMIHDS